MELQRLSIDDCACLQPLKIVIYMKSGHLFLAATITVLLQPLVGLLTFLPVWKWGVVPLEAFAGFSIAVLLVSSFVVFLFGITWFSVLQKTRTLNFLSLSASGIVIAMLPYLLIARPPYRDGYTATGQWHGMVLKAYEAGEPMALAWLEYAETALAFGVHGFSCSLVFYVFWRKYGRLEDA